MDLNNAGESCDLTLHRRPKRMLVARFLQKNLETWPLGIKTLVSLSDARFVLVLLKIASHAYVESSTAASFRALLLKWDTFPLDLNYPNRLVLWNGSCKSGYKSSSFIKKLP